MNDEMKLHHERMLALVAFTASSFQTLHPSPFGGAIYTADGRLLAQAYDSVIRECDPTCHGEVNAIRQASKILGSRWLAGCTMYSTCEPCAMCTAATIWAGIDQVVFGAFTNEDATHFWPQEMDLRTKDLTGHMVQRPQITVIEGVEREACKLLFTQCASAMKRLGIEI
ncbi:tRNA-specific adenosine deaminase [Pseudovibrio sp. Ad5]|uniref:nucleoside deaminase n=1 Tax=Pseudovibrio sp. Ad5 TaxID=989436 RepID=UPI0007AED098|nr:nucleoside deaminase [Pseudovibrio sp. Ad5]KZL00016.1 tRNA-specific adenosine deaminase [Pseudovibrio sp. Ad5]